MLKALNCNNKTLRIGVVFFLLLSVADFLLTWRLISAANSEIDEINPVASWVLANFGWMGLAAYKLTLVSGIACLVTVIANRKKAVGTSVMMFGCGAQASIVITGMMLLHGTAPLENELREETPAEICGKESDRLLPIGGFALLLDASVQRELGLSAAVTNHVTEISLQRNLLCQKSRAENTVDCFDLVCSLYGQERLLATSLTEKQFKRLQQLCLQAHGPLAFWQSEIAEALNFDDDQVDALHQIRNEPDMLNLVMATTAGGGLAFHGASNLQATKSRMLAVLDKVQLSRWQELQGDPFQFTYQTNSCE